MTNDHSHPVENQDEDDVAVERHDAARMSSADFMLLASTVLAAVIGALVAVFTTVSIWAIVLVASGVLLALAANFAKWIQVRWFNLASMWALVAVLIVSGLYLTISGRRAHALPLPPARGSAVKAPKLAFVKTSPATVPWCNRFYLTTDARIPKGDEILIFDASTDPQFSVTSVYNFDFAASPVSRVPDEWVTDPIYPGSRYREDSHGENVVRDGRPISNAGYTVAIFAVIVPGGVGQLLKTVGAFNNEWGLIRLPARALVTAQLDTVRNSNVRQCARTAS